MGKRKDSEQNENLKKWGTAVNIYQACHKEYALSYGKWATILTLAVVALNAVVSGAIFSSLTEDESVSFQSPARIVAAVLSIAAAVCSAIRSALRLETVSEQHASAGRRFGKLYVRFNDMHQLLGINYTAGAQKKADAWKDWYKDY